MASLDNPAQVPTEAASGGVALPGVLFTAFEPSGDDHASAVIAELKRRHPEMPIYAWGGPKMAKAGAVVIEATGDDAVMGMPGIAKIREHQLINQRIDAWLSRAKIERRNVVMHVPVDSPAANFPICEIAKRHGLRVVHLVAPQIWAWGRWRINKLRRLTDMVLCLLPFEERFFSRRRVPAKFIGHMLFDKKLDFAALDRRAMAYGEGSPRIAMMPGSRPAELEKNFPLILQAFAQLKRDFPNASGVVAATSPAVGQRLRGIAEDHGGWPKDVALGVRDTDAIIRWCEIALVKSGTVTLQVCKQQRPMVIFYKKSNPVVYFLAKTILATKKFALPNLIAGREIVPELIPLFGGPERLIHAARLLINNPAIRRKQCEAQYDMLHPFRGRVSAELAADEIERALGFRERPVADPALGLQGELVPDVVLPR